MKRLYNYLLILLALLLPATATAHDFEVDGIYYNRGNSNEVYVTYRGASSSQYWSEYSGLVAIPATVTYGGTTYSVTSIGDDAFANCGGLTSITIPNSVTSIGGWAFLNCAITQITIPDSVTSIGNHAFDGCSKLTSIFIPSSVITIGDNPFARCTNLSSIKVADDNQFYDSRDNSNTIIEIASNSLIAACNSSFIPNSVTSIGKSAFYGCNGLTSINIPNSVTEIGERAFSDCTVLTSIDIPNSVITIGSFAFSYCSRLNSVTIPNSVINIGENVFSSVLIPTLTIEGEGVWPGGGIDCSTNCLTIDSRITSVKGMKVKASVIYCYSITPPTCDENSFTDYSGTLHVPATSLSSYFIADYWSNFANIVGDAVELTDISISRDSVEVSIGTIFSLTATITPANATPNNVMWRSTDTAIATVNNGRVAAVGVGECDIIAQCLNKKSYCHLVVNDTIITVTLEPKDAMVLPNHLVILEPDAYPVMVDGFVVSSSDPAVAAARIVNGKIQVIGIKEGTTMITASSIDGTAIPDTCFVTVYTELGDVNRDGYVDISDVTNLIDYLLSGNGNSNNLTNADCNTDGRVDISDVTMLIDCLLGGVDLNPPKKETFTVNGVSFVMVKVPFGTFTMGPNEGYTGDNWEYPRHEVTLSPYYIGETEVTQALWKAVMGYNPSTFKYDYRPVETVSWNQCQLFINKLNELTGMCFRLPTEAEWEYAARGGNKSKGYICSGSNDADEVAWYWDNIPSERTQPVAMKKANELGLYDMSGNVSEWCNDWYDTNYYSYSPIANPKGPQSGSNRVERSNSWGYAWSSSYGTQYAERLCRVWHRLGLPPTESSKYVGFRLAL